MILIYNACGPIRTYSCANNNTCTPLLNISTFYISSGANTLQGSNSLNMNAVSKGKTLSHACMMTAVRYCHKVAGKLLTSPVSVTCRPFRLYCNRRRMRSGCCKQMYMSIILAVVASTMSHLTVDIYVPVTPCTMVNTQHILQAMTDHQATQKR